MGVDFTGAEQFASWDISAVAGTLEDYVATHKPAPVIIDRKQFYEIFNSFKFTTPNGAFMGLSLDVYDRLKMQQNNVFLAEPFVLLVLLSEGDIYPKTQLIYRIFDEILGNGDKNLDQDEMTVLISTLFGSLQKVGCLDQKPNKKELTDAVRNMYTVEEMDRNGDGLIDCNEFCRWAQKNKWSSDFMQQFDGDTVQTMLNLKRARLDEKTTASLHRGRGIGHTEVRAADRQYGQKVTQARQSDQVKQDLLLMRSSRTPARGRRPSNMPAQSGRRPSNMPSGRRPSNIPVQSGRRASKLPGVGGAPATRRASKLPGALAGTEGAPVVEQKKGAWNGPEERAIYSCRRLTKSEKQTLRDVNKQRLDEVCDARGMVDLSMRTRFTLKQLENFRQLFLDHAYSKDKKRGVVLDEMAKVLLSLFPTLDDRFLVEAICAELDHNNDGMVTFEEYVEGASKLTGSSTPGDLHYGPAVAKMDWVFRIHDSGTGCCGANGGDAEDGYSGQIPAEAMLRVMQAGQVEVVRSMDFSDELIYSLMDTNSNGPNGPSGPTGLAGQSWLSVSEFEKSLERIPTLFDTCWGSLPVCRTIAANEAVEVLTWRFKHFTLGTIVAILRDQAGVAKGTVSEQAFVHVVDKHLLVGAINPDLDGPGAAALAADATSSATSPVRSSSSSEASSATPTREPPSRVDNTSPTGELLHLIYESHRRKENSQPGLLDLVRKSLARPCAIDFSLTNVCVNSWYPSQRQSTAQSSMRCCSTAQTGSCRCTHLACNFFILPY
jgi:Ca2+-binding EF-hand superfamily protein